MSKQQTAVDYLLEYCERENWSIPFEVEHTAKEMEKGQIMDAFEQGENNSVDYFNPENNIEESEQYYNETFNTEEK